MAKQEKEHFSISTIIGVISSNYKLYIIRVLVKLMLISIKRRLYKKYIRQIDDKELRHWFKAVLNSPRGQLVTFHFFKELNWSCWNPMLGGISEDIKHNFISYLNKIRLRESFKSNLKQIQNIFYKYNFAQANKSMSYLDRIEEFTRNTNIKNASRDNDDIKIINEILSDEVLKRRNTKHSSARSRILSLLVFKRIIASTSKFTKAECYRKKLKSFIINYSFKKGGSSYKIGFGNKCKNNNALICFSSLGDIKQALSKDLDETNLKGDNALKEEIEKILSTVGMDFAKILKKNAIWWTSENEIISGIKSIRAVFDLLGMPINENDKYIKIKTKSKNTINIFRPTCKEGKLSCDEFIWRPYYYSSKPYIGWGKTLQTTSLKNGNPEVISELYKVITNEKIEMFEPAGTKLPIPTDDMILKYLNTKL